MRQARMKKIAFLVPRPGLELAAFYRHWRGTHGPTVANAPGYATYRSRYAQNHRLGDGPVGGSFPYPGAAIFHLPGDGSNEAAFSASPTYREHIRVEELNFIDMDRTVAIAAREVVVRPGTGPAKLLIAGRRRAGLPQAEFIAWLAAARAAELSAARGLVLNDVIAGSLSLPGARPAEAQAVDCVEEIWFASAADIVVAADLDLSPYDRTSVVSFLAEEIVFFDAGRPI